MNKTPPTQNQPSTIERAKKEIAFLLCCLKSGESLSFTEVKHAEETIALLDSASPWIKTAERPPTEKDADEFGDILARETDDSGPKAKGWRAVSQFYERWKWWMSIPPVPQQQNV